MSEPDHRYTPSQEDTHDQHELLQVHRRRLHYLLLAREQHDAKDVPLTVSMRNWYFEKGGLFLSENSRGPYFELKEVLRNVISDPNHQTNELLSNEEVGAIVEVASKLRASLSRDLGTR